MPKGPSRSTNRRQLESRYRAIEEQEREKEEGKKLLRAQYTWLSRREKESLYERSNQYPQWEQHFIDTIENLRANGIHSAKDFATYFAKRNFRTLGGLPLSPHLVSVLRDKYRREGKMHQPRNADLPTESQIGKKIGRHKSHYMYRPIPSSDDDAD